MTFVIITGGIDLSVGSIVGFCGMVAGGLILHGIDLRFGYTVFFNIPEIILITLALGIFIGLINGLLITRLNVAPFIATLGTLYVARGAALLLSDGATFPNLEGNPAFGTTGYAFLGAGNILNLPVSIWILIIVALGAAYLARSTPLGRHIFAVVGQRAGRGSAGHPRQSSEAFRVHVLRLLRCDRRPDHFFGVDGGASGDRHDVRIERHRRGSSWRYLHFGGRARLAARSLAPSWSAFSPMAS
jgi:predicted ABC-type sugar transport system permease subunit